MRVTTKGQVTIPRNIREILGIIPETEIAFSTSSILVKPIDISV
jgi:AbrB family looped-hinge helix DNA binding protein